MKFKKCEESELQKTAQDIGKMFIEEHSQWQLNIDDEVRNTIIEAIYSDNITRDIFQDAEKTAYELLRFSIIPLWRQSDLFKAVEDFSQLESKKFKVVFTWKGKKTKKQNKTKQNKQNKTKTKGNHNKWIVKSEYTE